MFPDQANSSPQSNEKVRKENQKKIKNIPITIYNCLMDWTFAWPVKTLKTSTEARQLRHRYIEVY